MSQENVGVGDVEAARSRDAQFLGERRVLGEFQDSPRQSPQDLALDAGVLVEHLLKVLGCQYEEPERRLRRGGGRSGGRLEQRDLAEEVAGTQRGDAPAFPRNIDFALNQNKNSWPISPSLQRTLP
jgi:hypothetical protein